jgi:HEPN domain-containing protein
MAERSKDWLKQAEKDLSHAKNSLKDKDYEWSCFASQQAAEKALKAVYEKKNLSVKGHSIIGLLEGLKPYFSFPKEFYKYARILSRYYIEARYPNGFPEGAPLDYFDKDMAEEAINASEKIVRWCRNAISRYK